MCASIPKHSSSMKTLSRVFSLMILGDNFTCRQACMCFPVRQIMVFDGTQTPAGVSVVHAEASPAPSSFSFPVWCDLMAKPPV